MVIVVMDFGENMHNHKTTIDKMDKLRKFVMFKMTNYKKHPDYKK